MSNTFTTGPTSAIHRFPRALLVLTKPRLVFLLAFTGAASLLVAGRFAIPLAKFVIVVAAIVLSSAGANTMTSYLDRGVDAKMKRTQKRPLPQRCLSPRVALLCGVLLSAAGLLLAWPLGLLFFFIGLAGLLDNVLVYSLLAKRRTWMSVLLGSFSGGAPALGGWVAATESLGMEGIILAGLVIFWIPGHIWSLALFYGEDYKAAGVPMLPAVTSEKMVTRTIVLTVLLLAGLSFAPFLWGFAGVWYLVISLPFTALVVAGNVWMALSPSKPLSWKMFKVSSPYLFILFLALIADTLLRWH